MTYVINAFLECEHPSLKVLSRSSGKVMFSFGEFEVRQMLESGDLCAQDLLSTKEEVHAEVVKQLALYHCKNNLPRIDEHYTASKRESKWF